MQQFVNGLAANFGGSLLNFVWAILILIGGWILALLIAATVRRALERTTVDNKLAARMGFDPSKTNFESIVGKVVFYIVMLFVLVAIFQVLQLTIVTQPLTSLLDGIFAYVPNLLGAGILALVAWALASAVRFIISKVLGAFQLDDKMASQVEIQQEGRPPMSETLATIGYWFIWLLFLPNILGALELQGLLQPVQAMLTDILGYLPDILGAAIIIFVGWFVARIIRQIVTNFLAAIGTDSLGERVGVGTATGGQSLSTVIGTVVYVLVLIPVLISGLQALKIEAISGPATNMLNTLLDAVPNIFGAMIILGVTYFIAQLVSGLVITLLTSVGFNKVLGLIGLGSDVEEGQRTPSEIVGYLVLIGLMLFATVEAANILGFEILADLVAAFISFASQILVGIVVLGIGLYLAKVAHTIILNTAGEQASLLAQVARIGIIILTVAMGLRQTGIADDIINLAFGLLLGAIAIAAALAFGLGAREVAGREVESIVNRMRSGDS
jgi:hypothetical protein